MLLIAELLALQSFIELRLKFILHLNCFSFFQYEEFMLLLASIELPELDCLHYLQNGQIPLTHQFAMASFYTLYLRC
jgi:hypothetical protein